MALPKPCVASSNLAGGTKALILKPPSPRSGRGFVVLVRSWRAKSSARRVDQGSLRSGPGHLHLVVLGPDQELLEEELVRQAADSGTAEAVDLVHPADQREGAVQRGLDVLVDD